MNDEIKEILDCFKRHIEQNESMCCLSMIDVPVLLDYITNLQKENKHLSKSYADSILFNQKRCEHNKELQQRIDNAIEYIDDKVLSNGEVIDQLRIIEVEKLLNILNGGDEE